MLFCEPKQLYQVKQDMEDSVYESDYTIPLGLADVKCPGRDVTLVAVGLMVPRAIQISASLRVSKTRPACRKYFFDRLGNSPRWRGLLPFTFREGMCS